MNNQNYGFQNQRMNNQNYGYQNPGMNPGMNPNMVNQYNPNQRMMNNNNNWNMGIPQNQFSAGNFPNRMQQNMGMNPRMMPNQMSAGMGMGNMQGMRFPQ